MVRRALLLFPDSQYEILQLLQRVIVFAVQLLGALEHQISAPLLQSLEVIRAIPAAEAGGVYFDALYAIFGPQQPGLLLLLFAPH